MGQAARKVTAKDPGEKLAARGTSADWLSGGRTPTGRSS